MKKCKVLNCESNAGQMKKGFCNYHYKVDYDLKQINNPKKVIKQNNPSHKKELRTKLSGSSQSLFFQSLRPYIPNNCQCCGESLQHTISFNFTICMAHILEKSRYEFFIVSANKKNIVFLCDYCHNGFDNKGKDWFEKQKTEFKELIYDRVKYLSNLLSESQQTHIKEYLIKK